MSQPETKWDVFISYASEDRSEVAEPLAQLLCALGITVWYDQIELKIGDSLRRKIDEGLSRCRYGVVILSVSFFAKHYPNRELDGLAQQELGGATVILPVWCGVTDAEVRSYSPPLADRIAARWEDGLIPVVFKILEVVRPDLLDTINRAAASVKALPELHSGREVIAVVNGALGYDFANDDLEVESEVELVGGFLQQLQDWGDIIDELDVSERLRAEFHVTEALMELLSAGWRVFGRQEKRLVSLPDKTEQWPVAVVFVARSNSEQVILLDNGDFAVSRRSNEGRDPSFNPAPAGV
jgi:TIR domain